MKRFALKTRFETGTREPGNGHWITFSIESLDLGDKKILASRDFKNGKIGKKNCYHSTFKLARVISFILV